MIMYAKNQCTVAPLLSTPSDVRTWHSSSAALSTTKILYESPLLDVRPWHSSSAALSTTKILYEYKGGSAVAG